MRVVNLRKSEKGTYVYIGRGSIFGNPYTHLPLANTKAEFQCSTREESIRMYEAYARANDNIMGHLHELVGKDLGCFCYPKSCHGDILVKLVNERYPNAATKENLDVQRLLFPRRDTT